LSSSDAYNIGEETDLCVLRVDPTGLVWT